MSNGRQISYAKPAVKALRKMGSVAAGRIREKVAQYAIDPIALANNVTELKGSELKRLRVGDYRVIFTEDMIVMTVLKVGHRREIYD